jgi:hypothetical protein
MFVCDSWYVLFVLVDCLRVWMEWTADSRLRHTTRTNSHIYTLLPPDDGLLSSLKHVEM